MSEPVLVASDLPKGWRKFRMPSAMHDRLQDLLDKQDREGKLSPRERREARGLTELVDMLAVMSVRGSTRIQAEEIVGAHIPTAMAAVVRERAGDCCEYCRLPQSSQEAKFHIDHIQPRSYGGPTVVENLCEACVTCSLKKAARTFARDPATGQMTPLFHPRRDQWHEHFAWTSTWRLAGKTATGRATIQALAMNRPAVLFVRRGLVKLGQFSTT